MKFYIDFRTNSIEDEITLDINHIAPEDYCEYSKGALEDLYIETWDIRTPDGNCESLDITYSLADRLNEILPNLRTNAFNEHKVEPLRPRRIMVPPSEYDHTLEYYGYEKGEDFY